MLFGVASRLSSGDNPDPALWPQGREIMYANLSSGPHTVRAQNVLVHMSLS